MQVFDRVGELRVRHQEGADPSAVELVDELVDLRVHDRLADEGERAVAGVHRLLESVFPHAGDALALADHLPVQLHALGDDELRRVHAPLPLLAHRVLVVPPAEGALVGTGQRRRRLHALVRRDAVEGVLVAAAPPTKLMLRPAAELHGGVPADELVALLRQLRTHPRGQHLLVVDLARRRGAAARGHVLQVLRDVRLAARRSRVALVGVRLAVLLALLLRRVRLGRRRRGRQAAGEPAEHLGQLGDPGVHLRSGILRVGDLPERHQPTAREGRQRRVHAGGRGAVGPGGLVLGAAEAENREVHVREGVLAHAEVVHVVLEERHEVLAVRRRQAIRVR
mmetsp:Transcript_26654/g.79508  ORF Transcript_26654/g.79508 Transcript_26654/m.79508 type:complete len:338 (-) Transcript_26654:402-1415(-)